MKAVTTAAAVCFAAIQLAAVQNADAKARRLHADMDGVGSKTEPHPAADINGGWGVDAATTVGQCAGLIPTAIEIADGRVTGAAGAQGESWGYVNADGTIVARFTTSSGHVARFHGNLRGGHGAGAWSSSTDFCGGTWRATRGGQESAAR